MPTALTIEDFQLRQVTCEIRYPEAFVIYDRTGEIFQQLSKKFRNLRSLSPSPNQTQAVADEGTVVVELATARLTKDDPEAALTTFATDCRTLFSLVTTRLNVNVFTRIGLRLIYHKLFDAAADAAAAIGSFRLTKATNEPRFGASPNISEFMARWQGKELGATMRLFLEDGSITAHFPIELGMSERSVHKEFHHLGLDIDYYTVGTVEGDQWDAATWIPQSARIIKRETDKVLTT